MWHVQFYLLSGNILSVTRDNPFPIKIHATANATVIPAQSNTPVNPVPIFNNLLYFWILRNAYSYFSVLHSPCKSGKDCYEWLACCDLYGSGSLKIKEFVFLSILIMDISDDKLAAAQKGCFQIKEHERQQDAECAIDCCFVTGKIGFCIGKPSCCRTV